MNRTPFALAALSMFSVSVGALLVSLPTQASSDCGGRQCNYTLEARPYHVDAACLTDAQVDRLERGFGGRLGAVSFSRDEISDSCIVDQQSGNAPRDAGVSPFQPCGFGPSPFADRDCVYSAFFSENSEGVDEIAIINPDSMHPGCLVSANPTPHP